MEWGKEQEQNRVGKERRIEGSELNKAKKACRRANCEGCC